MEMHNNPDINRQGSPETDPQADLNALNALKTREALKAPSLLAALTAFLVLLSAGGCWKSDDGWTEENGEPPPSSTEYRLTRIRPHNEAYKLVLNAWSSSTGADEQVEFVFDRNKEALERCQYWSRTTGNNAAQHRPTPEDCTLTWNTINYRTALKFRMRAQNASTLKVSVYEGIIDVDGDISLGLPYVLYDKNFVFTPSPISRIVPLPPREP
ncbi:MAG: hypothetical protein OEZ59_07145 [Deltaproteobacteria bacterium]|nr:hypothetical protein [Deltaproteobacteria bacterium]